jgi:hypothetical protein
MANPNELYDQIESLISDRSVWGQGNTPEAAHYKSVVNPQIAKLRRELNRLGLPSRRWQYDAMQEAEDVADLPGTQQDVIYG